jgi:hypothetical protein
MFAPFLSTIHPVGCSMFAPTRQNIVLLIAATRYLDVIQQSVYQHSILVVIALPPVSSVRATSRLRPLWVVSLPATLIFSLTKGLDLFGHPHCLQARYNDCFTTVVTLNPSRSCPALKVIFALPPAIQLAIETSHWVYGLPRQPQGQSGTFTCRVDLRRYVDS